MAEISGLYEYFFGSAAADADDALDYWATLGFTSQAQGTLSADEAESLYGHGSALTGYRLAHPGSAKSGCGYVRLQVWETPKNAGLGSARPLDVGSRWMGMYTHDILRVRDSYEDGIENEGKPWELSPIVRAALDPSSPPATWSNRFVGLREMFVISPTFRHAFIQRAGFDRPGFGHFDPSTPLPVTEGSHGNIAQPSGKHSTAFYQEVFGLQSMGGAGQSGWQRKSTADVLMLQEGQTFTFERLGSPGKASGFLQVYAPDWDAPDHRDTRAGSIGLCQYSYRVDNLAEMAAKAKDAGATVTEVQKNELGEQSVSLVAPDGIAWSLVGD